MGGQPVQAGVERYQPYELVVELPHLRVVLNELRKYNVRPAKSDIDESGALGLAKVRLRQREVDDAADQFKRADWWPDDPVRLERRGPRNVYPIDELLFGLRVLFESRFGGWVPEFGKNRGLDLVYAKPEVQHHDNGWPEPFKPENGTFWGKRQAEPGLGVRVGVLDTELSPHPYLEGAYVETPSAILDPLKNPWYQVWNRFLDRPRRRWEFGHATFVSGLIVHRAPGARLDVRAVLNSEDRTSKDPSATTWDLAVELAKMAGSGASILNLSLGCYTLDGQPPLVLEKALARLPRELVVVAAAGNQGQSNPAEDPGAPTPDAPLYPAALPGVVAVAAADKNRKLAPFSPRINNPGYPGVEQPPPWVDVLAPGVDLESTYLAGGVDGLRKPTEDGRFSREFARRFHGFAKWNGSSFATAVVTGEIAAQTRPGQRGAAEVVAELLASQERGANRLPFVSLPK